MNQTKRDRIQKQLNKLLSKKSKLEDNIENEYNSMIIYIIINKVYDYYPNIKNALNLNIYDNNYILTSEELNNNDNLLNLILEKFKINIQDYYTSLNNLKSIKIEDLDCNNLKKVRDNITEFKNNNIRLENQKKEINIKIKELRQSFSDKPILSKKKILTEKTNLLSVIERINMLENKDNNNFVDNFYLLFNKINDINQKINNQKQNIKQQENRLQEIRKTNLKIRQDKIKSIHQFKIQYNNELKEKEKLVIQKNNIITSINKKIEIVNEQKSTIKLIKKNINQNNIIDSNQKILLINNEITLLLKKIDYLSKESKRYEQMINLYDTETHKNHDVPKVKTKFEIIEEKKKIHLLNTQLTDLLTIKKEIVAKQKKLIIDNIKYNGELEKEFQRAKNRLIKIVNRLKDSYQFDKDKLSQSINNELLKIANIDNSKKENLININTLETNMKKKFKHLDKLRNIFTNIETFKNNINSINVDINSYQRILN